MRACGRRERGKKEGAGGSHARGALSRVVAVVEVEVFFFRSLSLFALSLSFLRLSLSNHPTKLTACTCLSRPCTRSRRGGSGRPGFCKRRNEEEEEQSISVSKRGVDKRLTRASLLSLLRRCPPITLNLSVLGLWRTKEPAPTRPLSSGDEEEALLALAAASPLAFSPTQPILLFVLSCSFWFALFGSLLCRQTRARESLSGERGREKRSKRERERERLCETVEARSVIRVSVASPLSFFVRWPASAANKPRRGPARRSSGKAATLLLLPRCRPAARGLTARCKPTRYVY